MGISHVIGTQYLLLTKRQKEFTISITIGVVVNFVLNIIFIKLWNSIGASIATVVSQLVVVIAQFYMVKNEINIVDVFKGALNYLIASIIMFVACIIVKLFIKII